MLRRVITTKNTQLEVNVKTCDIRAHLSEKDKIHIYITSTVQQKTRIKPGMTKPMRYVRTSARGSDGP